MGQTLSEPITEKHSQSDGNKDLIYGISAMQGWRLTMEDAHCAFLQLPNCQEKAAFFAVFDGHGGEKTAKYTGTHLHLKLVDIFKNKTKNMKEALRIAFFDLDEELKRAPEMQSDPSGCTAVSCVITDKQIIVANAGDSRCIISVAGKAKPLSNDHKPNLKEEVDRITKAGGFVEFGRVNGNLALSRAFGDFEFKKNTDLPAEAQAVTVNPEIISHDIDEDTHFLVMACDGIWDCMSNQEVVDFVATRIAEGKPLVTICEQVIDYCLAPEATLGSVGCDNMSIIIVGFLKNGSEQEWLERCKKAIQDSPQ